MPELPEVQTTVNGLNKVLKNLTVSDVWTDYFVNTKNKRVDTIKNESFFKTFKKEIVGAKFVKAERRGKNILIHFSENKTILIHMKMTGHLLYGTYSRKSIVMSHESIVKTRKLKIENSKLKIGDYKWISNDKHLSDPFNQFIHFIINFSNGKSLAFSDMRKFAKVTLFETNSLPNHPDIKILGPEANDITLTWHILKEQLFKRPKGKIKTILMDQTVVAGIGNIYSDEILWTCGIHPERTVEKLSDSDIKNILKSARVILAHSITLGGDSMSDYRNIHGERGGYQKSHKVYRRTKEKCLKKGCGGTIVRKVIGGRSAHFCSIHQV
jgi:formamidopyrimidine-DNA glycosylase